MGQSIKPIMFYSDEITIVPHTATHERHLSRPVTIREFSQNGPCFFEKVLETGEYVVRLPNGDFIQGPEAD